MGPTGFYQWLAEDPPILYYAAHSDEDIGDRLPESRVYRLPIYHWHRSADDIEREHLRARANRPRHVLHHLINEREVTLDLQARGIPATFSNHNATIDERIFTVHEGANKVADAVYSARMNPFKRHALAGAIPSLLMIGGVIASGDNQEYFDRIRALLPQARFTHDEGRRWIPPDRVATALNSARVGLCLSACEGAMYSATEYLLCGLPVVSTASLGGRDEWFDPRYSRVVRDDPGAIADAVRELIALDLSPRWIRQQTLSRLWKHRRRLVDRVQDIYDREQVGRDYAREWYARFFNKLGRWREFGELMLSLRTDCPRLDVPSGR